MLEVSNLTAGYGAATVLEDVSISVDEGKFVVVTGPNGHGKTTLLRVLSGLLPVDAATIAFLGERLNGRSAATIVGRGLVHIPQGDLLFVDLTVEQNLYMGALSQRRLEGPPRAHPAGLRAVSRASRSGARSRRARSQAASAACSASVAAS